MPDTASMNKLSAVMSTYSRFPITVTKGKGSYMWDDVGEKYLDYTSGIATCNLGHCPDSVQLALHEQVDQLWHSSNLYHIPQQTQLAEKLTGVSCFDQAFFCNSGAEANEAAIKLAKKYTHDHQLSHKNQIVSFTSSFHGRTGTTMAATAQSKIHEGFAPLTPGFHYCEFNDQEAIEGIDYDTTIAVILELIQGEGGVRQANKEWVQTLVANCKKHNVLVIIDEIQTGMGRTGSMFAYEHYDIEPDIITLAKGLGSGIPVGAMLAKQHVSQSFQPGTHGSTFGGNPLAMTAGIATLNTLTAGHILANVVQLSSILFKELEKMKKSIDQIEEVRGLGFLIGIQFSHDVAPIVKKLRDKNILCLIAGPKVLRILPPLNTTEVEINVFVTALKNILTDQEDAS
ncbi:acetylornithine transaminase [Salipaludibacillus agaradhaerens]|uniref:Acetylornithine aminotransferase n=1 Tax=Salipaludibacillus agaradhaerens TaxID=76935 RepID=A0A9Q4FZ22_SALAG|nr:acetylornithine transaminase [Salipaludibacillus agaradhaerens]MCR6096334.1 acetylornithine transaminase [Salipaludibacillus agaradhaerens]MCR6114107.1 acetylornithine transaminase [Salipaludibacillus agaradhaerens]